MTDFKGWIAPVGSIKLQDLIDDLGNDERRGAITTFTGVTRSVSDASEKKVEYLEVEAWEGETSKSMNSIAKDVGKKFSLQGIRIVHLEGKIPLGSPIVYVVISSIHRKEAFKALEEAINRYKHDSPVWKKEVYTDGSGTWITTKPETK